MKKILRNHYVIDVVVFAMTTLALIACSDDSGSSAPEQTSESIESTDSDLFVKIFDDLPVCSDNRKGVTAYVKDEKNAYVCENSDWVPDSAVDRDDSSRLSSPKAFSSSSDKTSSSSPKTKSSSSNNKAWSLSSGKVVSSSSKDKSNSSSSGKDSLIAIKNKTISGLCQKGPFVAGSTVKLYELDGRTFAQTGKIFSGKITSDDGKFSIPSVTLASQYALLEVTGYFLSEVTNYKSEGTMTLNALTDLSDRKNVNINLLTHLEYDRVMHLIESGINFAAAKKQAETEVLNAFSINDEIVNFEDLDIFGEGNGNAALLALSVLMLEGTAGAYLCHAELREADLTEILAEIAIDVAEDGMWDDEKIKAELSYKVMRMDLYRDYSSLENRRKIIESWKFGDFVPDFEKYVRNYWYANCGIGNCDSQNEGDLGVIDLKEEILKWTESFYNFKRVICRNGSWKKATYLDVDLHNAKIPENPKDGDFWTETETGQVYKYFQNEGVWVYAQFGEVELNIGGCTPKRNGDVVNTDDEFYYVCRKFEANCSELQCMKDSVDCYCLQSGYRWDMEYDDTYGMPCTSKEVGLTIDGVVTSTNKYYCSVDGWIRLKN